MAYLKVFTFPNDDMEFDFLIEEKRMCYDSFYPFKILSTHSPFLLAMNGAKIYDLDENPVDVKKWTELENVRTYYEFFKRYEREF